MSAWRIENVKRGKHEKSKSHLMLSNADNPQDYQVSVLLSQNDLDYLSKHFRVESVMDLIGKVFGSNETTAQLAMNAFLTKMVNAKI